MNNKIYFKDISNLKKFLQELSKNKERKIFNFLNSNDIYNFVKEPAFSRSFLKESLNFIDGFMISRILSILHFRKIKRQRGPDFTKYFLGVYELTKDKRQFFIGLEKDDLDEISKKYPNLKRKNLFGYNPPYIKGIEFPDEEVEKIAKRVNSKNADYVWIGLGSPKQNILSRELFEKTAAVLFFNVGAALDFLLGKKKRAPKFFQSIGLEWFYRLVTDFKYSKKKVWRSLIGSFYINSCTKLDSVKKAQ